MLAKELSDYRDQMGSTLLEGYISFLNDGEQSKYTELAHAFLSNYGDITIFGITAFADLLGWDGEYVYLVKLIDENVEVISRGLGLFFQNLRDEEYQKDYFDLKLYQEAREKCGELLEEECYAFEPIPALGGKKDVEYIRKSDREGYIRFLATVEGIM